MSILHQKWLQRSTRFMQDIQILARDQVPILIIFIVLIDLLKEIPFHVSLTNVQRGKENSKWLNGLDFVYAGSYIANPVYYFSAPGYVAFLGSTPIQYFARVLITICVLVCRIILLFAKIFRITESALWIPSVVKLYILSDPSYCFFEFSSSYTHHLQFDLNVDNMNWCCFMEFSLLYSHHFYNYPQYMAWWPEPPRRWGSATQRNSSDAAEAASGAWFPVRGLHIKHWLPLSLDRPKIPSRWLQQNPDQRREAEKTTKS